MGKRALVIGFDPYTIDFDTPFFRGKPLSAEIIAKGLEADEARIVAAGHDCQSLMIDARGTPEAAADATRAALAARPVDVVVIGGGVRLDPAQTLVLEALVNTVMQAAPGTRIGFNTMPTDTAEAVGRG